jgi:hypothetical protein
MEIAIILAILAVGFTVGRLGRSVERDSPKIQALLAEIRDRLGSK